MKKGESGSNSTSSTKSGGGVSILIPAEVWKYLTEIRLQLDSSGSGAPTPIEEVLRQVAVHYRTCPRAEEELEAYEDRGIGGSKK